MKKLHRVSLLLASFCLAISGCGNNPGGGSKDDPSIDKVETNKVILDAYLSSASLKKENNKYYVDASKDIVVNKTTYSVANGQKEIISNLKIEKCGSKLKQTVDDATYGKYTDYYYFNSADGVDALGNKFSDSEAYFGASSDDRYELGSNVYYPIWSIFDLRAPKMSLFEPDSTSPIDKVYTKIDDNHYRILVGNSPSYELDVDMVNKRFDKMTMLDNDKNEYHEITFTYNKVDDFDFPTKLVGRKFSSRYVSNTVNLLSDITGNYRFNHKELYRDSDGNPYYVENHFDIDNNKIGLLLNKNEVVDGQEKGKQSSSAYYVIGEESTYAIIGTGFGNVYVSNPYGFLYPYAFSGILGDIEGIATYDYLNLTMEMLSDEEILYTYDDVDNNKSYSFDYVFDNDNIIITSLEVKVANITTKEIEEYESFSITNIGSAYAKPFTETYYPKSILEKAFNNLEANVEYTLTGENGNEKYDGYRIGVLFGRGEDTYHITPKEGKEYYLKREKTVNGYVDYASYSVKNSSGTFNNSTIDDADQINELLKPYSEVLEIEFNNLRSLTLNNNNVRLDITNAQLEKGAFTPDGFATIYNGDVMFKVYNPTHISGSGIFTLANLPSFTIGGQTYTGIGEKSNIVFPE